MLEELVYIFDKEQSLSLTEYKVMQSETVKCLLPAVKMLFNGKTQIYYLTKGKDALLSINSLRRDDCIQIVLNILQGISEIRENGFLKTNNISCDLNAIYVDPTSWKVSLMYVPCNPPLYKTENEFDEKYRIAVKQMLLERGLARFPEIAEIIDLLSDYSLGSEELAGKIRLVSSLGHRTSEDRQLELILASRIKGISSDFFINKNGYLIGRRAQDVDGVVKGSRLVGRIHARIDRTKAGFYITDLNSTNGTYVNGIRVTQQPFLLNDGDVVQLADVEYTVCIR